MNGEEFRAAAASLAEFIVNYRENIVDRRVIPDMKPGDLFKRIPDVPPMEPETWSSIMDDLDKIIMPAMTHWQHPHFHAYFGNGATYPGVLADMVASSLGVNVTSWTACPVATELEMHVTDWFAKALDLPKQFMFSEPDSTGGGMMATSASEAILCAMLAARAQAIECLKESTQQPDTADSDLLPRLVMYCSVETHSCVEKAAMIGLVQLRILGVDEDCALRGETLKQAIIEDMKKDLHPFFVVATVGTTGSSAIDNIQEIGEITSGLPACWLHVDGAYGGSSFCCPEMREPMAGMERCDSFNFNPNKWFLVTPECSCLFVKDRTKLQSSLVTDVGSLYEGKNQDTQEYRHWSVALGRKFRALQVWATLKSLGLETVQECIRNHCKLAKLFESYIREDERFEVMNKVQLSCVAFRMKGENKLTEMLLDNLNNGGEVHMIPSVIAGKYVIRFVPVIQFATAEHVDFAWKQIQKEAKRVFNDLRKLRRRNSSLAFVGQVDNEAHRPGRRGSLPDFGKLVDLHRIVEEREVSRHCDNLQESLKPN